MTRLLLPALLIAFGISAAQAEMPEGNWRFTQKLNAAADNPILLIQFKKIDGKLHAWIVDQANPKAEFKLGTPTVDGDTLTMTIESNRKWTFQGHIDPKNPNVIRGRLSDDTGASKAMLTMQPAKIERPEPPKAPAPMALAQNLISAMTQIQIRLQQLKAPDDRKPLLAQLNEIRKQANEKLPALYREVVAIYSDSPYAVDAANSLLRSAARIKPTADEIATWVKLMEADAARYGPAVTADTALQIAELLTALPDHASSALPLAEKAAKGLKESDPLRFQSLVLKVLVAAEKAAGKSNPATEARLTKVEAALDVEYHKTIPPFKPTKFTGRKDSAANRVVVMELFTGAQCPPCVAADVAFDALGKAYSTRDLVLIQYHMHIPGPDPLTNPASIARWDFYRTKFETQIRGTPATLFNGKPEAYGGGGLANAENKYSQYADIINPLLEQKTDLKITGTAKTAGEKINVALALDGIADPGAKVRLHVLLVEESVKYVGSNQLRFHHQVVRALAGDADGFELSEKTFKKTVDFDLPDVKKGLIKYLDEFAAETPFPNPDRPMDLKHLKVIALVQNSETLEILNAVQLEVEDK
jgi:hypothetical protein